MKSESDARNLFCRRQRVVKRGFCSGEKNLPKSWAQKGLLSILHTAGICQIDRWIGNALDTELHLPVCGKKTKLAIWRFWQKLVLKQQTRRRKGFFCFVLKLMLAVGWIIPAGSRWRRLRRPRGISGRFGLSAKENRSENTFENTVARWQCAICFGCRSAAFPFCQLFLLNFFFCFQHLFQ